MKRAWEAGQLFSKQFEIVVCNDASPDLLASELCILKRSIPEMRIMTHKKNQGYGPTLKDLYFEGKNECDFIIKSGRTITQAIQVADYLSDPKTRKREIEGLLSAMDTFGLKKGLIIIILERL